MTSNGFSWTAESVSCDSSGMTCTPSASSTAHVNPTVNVSPMRTAALLVRHQQRIGSTSTIFAGLSCAAASAGAANSSPVRIRR